MLFDIVKAGHFLDGAHPIYGDDETTRELDPEERAALVEMAEKRKTAAAKSAAARKAKKAAAEANAEPATGDMFAKA